MKKHSLKKAVLTLFILFHFFAIAVAPNSYTYLASRAAFLVIPYINIFGLASQWGFFAPDPGPPPVFLEYEYLGANKPADNRENQGTDATTIGSGIMPQKGDPHWIHEFQNRRVSVVRFSAFFENRVSKLIAPYLCRQNKQALSVRIWRVLEDVPTMESVAEGKRKIGDGRVAERKWIGQYLCEARS